MFLHPSSDKKKKRKEWKEYLYILPKNITHHDVDHIAFPRPNSPQDKEEEKVEDDGWVGGKLEREKKLDGGKKIEIDSTRAV